MKNPLFSILIPCYNSEKYLNKCIQSVLSQNFSVYEVICEKFVELTVFANSLVLVIKSV